MNTDLKNLLTFHWTGKTQGPGLDAMGKTSLRPAILAQYRDLSQLRYDYPVVLANGGSALSLTGIFNAILQRIAPEGIASEQLRKNGLRLEQGIRQLVADGKDGTLSQLWETAQEQIPADEVVAKNLDSLHRALDVDGEVIDCTNTAAAQIVEHLWQGVVHGQRCEGQQRVELLVLGIFRILEANRQKTAAARSAEELSQSIGLGYRDAFDFSVLSDILVKAAPKNLLPASRQQRLEQVLDQLQSQKFFCAEGHPFLFDTCGAAQEAFAARLPELVDLVKAISIAELEIANAYKEDKHDAFFAGFKASSLTARDLGLFPSYLVVTDREQLNETTLFELLSSSLPINICVQTKDLLNGSVAGGLTTNRRTLRLANMALGLDSAFVLQSSASNLVQVANQIQRGCEFNGPALFSIYAGGGLELSPYLASASAMQARLFPAFTFDPTAGSDWASRFSLAHNPQVGLDWPEQGFQYQDQDLQSHNKSVAFTFVDFAACDARFGAHFAIVEQGHWCDEMVPVDEFLQTGTDEQVPSLMMVGGDNKVQQVVVDDQLIRAARHYAQMWHSLQELGGVKNSHAQALLAREHTAWEEEKAAEIKDIQSQLAPEAQKASDVVASVATTAESPVSVEEEAEEGPIEEAFIETVRCTTCNECTNLNNKLFVYNENKQAYIADLQAGTYRQMVEAAEACKVAIIHPGKPWNADEADLEELEKRAAPFN
ncbi:MAG: ferredoxin [Proteobacteria bacterium]|jgi:hypothetical protein|nr:ferredoxin [Pseudomonadota bacterium]